MTAAEYLTTNKYTHARVHTHIQQTLAGVICHAQLHKPDFASHGNLLHIGGFTVIQVKLKYRVRVMIDHLLSAWVGTHEKHTFYSIGLERIGRARITYRRLYQELWLEQGFYDARSGDAFTLILRSFVPRFNIMALIANFYLYKFDLPGVVWFSKKAGLSGVSRIEI